MLKINGFSYFLVMEFVVRDIVPNGMQMGSCKLGNVYFKFLSLAKLDFILMKLGYFEENLYGSIDIRLAVSMLQFNPIERKNGLHVA